VSKSPSRSAVKEGFHDNCSVGACKCKIVLKFDLINGIVSCFTGQST